MFIESARLSDFVRKDRNAQHSLFAEMTRDNHVAINISPLGGYDLAHVL
jgi:hypothetical protein